VVADIDETWVAPVDARMEAIDGAALLEVEMLPELTTVHASLVQAAPEIGWRLDAPFHLRLIVQPLVALLLGIRDGRLDAKAGTPPYVYDLLVSSADRGAGLRSGLDAIWKPLAIAVILDAVVQFAFLDRVSLLGALLVGGLLVGIPYVLARGVANRQVSRRQPDAPMPGP
jgi:hypothetical protein